MKWHSGIIDVLTSNNLPHPIDLWMVGGEKMILSQMIKNERLSKCNIQVEAYTVVEYAVLFLSIKIIFYGSYS